VTVRRRLAAVALFVAILVAGAACGGSDSGVSSAAGGPLLLRVAAIRSAAGRGDSDAVESQLVDLRADVVQFRADDKIDADAAARILDAIDNVKAKLSLLVPATSPTTTPETDPEEETTTTPETTTTSETATTVETTTTSEPTSTAPATTTTPAT
jgi:hypothetical protein